MKKTVEYLRADVVNGNGYYFPLKTLKEFEKEHKDDVYFLQNFNRHPVKMVLNECYTNLITDEILTGSIKLQTYQCIVMKKK